MMPRPHRLLLALAALVVSAAPAAAQNFTPTRFAVTVSGSGPDVILIPGLGSSAAVWAADAARLDDDHRVHVIQVAGFAGAPAGANAEGPILAPLAEELSAYIEANGLTRPAIVGHSLGGVVALLLAQAHPDHVGRIVVVDALPFFSVLYDPAATAERFAPGAAAFRDSVLAADAASFRDQQEMGVARLVRTPERRAEVIEWSLASDRGVLARAMYEVMTTDLRGNLPGIAAPLTVIYAHDPVMGPPALVDGLYTQNYAAAPNKSLVRIDGSYHFIMLDQPEAFHTALTAALH